MEPIRSDLVTIVGSSYFQPIADLIEQLSRLGPSENNEVQVSQNENGYSVSVILLLVTMFESYVMRVRYINRKKLPINKISVANYIDKLYPDYQHCNELTEVFVQRDLIAHNHLWEIDFAWTEDPGMTLLNATREVTAGDVKFHQTIDEKCHRTKTLGLNILPIKVGRGDVKRVFNVIWDTLIFLENKNRSNCYVSHLHVRYGGKTRLFGELINTLNA